MLHQPTNRRRRRKTTACIRSTTREQVFGHYQIQVRNACHSITAVRNKFLFHNLRFKERLSPRPHSTRSQRIPWFLVEA